MNIEIWTEGIQRTILIGHCHRYIISFDHHHNIVGWTSTASEFIDEEALAQRGQAMCPNSLTTSESESQALSSNFLVFIFPSVMDPQ